MFGAWHGHCIRDICNPNIPMNNPHESTYALIVRSDSEEKGRGVLEFLLYAVFIFATAFSIWQMTLQPVRIPAGGLMPSACLACEVQKGHELARS
jgi:hypothetical protein